MMRLYRLVLPALLLMPMVCGAETPPEKTPPPVPPVTVKEVKIDQAFGILGKHVADAAGTDMGPVVNVLVGWDGHPRAAVIDFGGFLGVGSRKIAVDWALLQFRPGDKATATPIVLNLVRSEVQAAPEYKDGADSASIVEAPPSQPHAISPTSMP